MNPGTTDEMLAWPTAPLACRVVTASHESVSPAKEISSMRPATASIMSSTCGPTSSRAPSRSRHGVWNGLPSRNAPDTNEVRSPVMSLPSSSARKARIRLE